LDDDYVLLARKRLLELINEERNRAGLSRLVLDELAGQVAAAHARDMAQGGFLSHWGSDGSKPYHRYSFAGGIDAVQENVASADNVPSLSAASLVKDLADMHAFLYNEIPPHDGHRRTILHPQHTHVGFGIARNEYSLRLDELFLSKYVALDAVPRNAKPKETLSISGLLLDPGQVLIGADIYYEQLPSPPAPDWLRTPRPWGLPEIRFTLQPKLSRKQVYVDGSKGSIERDKSKFRFPVTLFKDQPGVYTVLIWLARSGKDQPFPATEICIRGTNS
jgi:hypothetical protein